MEFTEPERPVGVQLFGGDPGIMGEAAVEVIERVQPGCHRHQLWVSRGKNS